MGDSLVIIIDAWTPQEHHSFNYSTRTVELAKRIIDFIDSRNPHAVLASYHCSAELYSDTVWYRNRLSEIEKLYSTKNFQTRIDQDYHAHLAEKQSTVDVLLNYVNPNVAQLAMREEKELGIYLQMHPEIKDIYIVGSAWEECVRNRPLGYLNVYNKFCKGSDRTVRTSSDHVTTYSGGPLKIDSNWQLIAPAVYQYCPIDNELPL